MTEADKKYFDSIFKSDKHFRRISEVDMLRSAGQCWKLRDYLESELGELKTEKDFLRFLHFAYHLGRVEVEACRRK